jgi:hypothetical protein
MSTLRVSNIEAKADASSPTIDEKIKVTNSQGRVLIQIDGKTAGITTVGINTTGNTFTVDPNGNIQFVGVITAANLNTTGVTTFNSGIVVSAGTSAAPSISPSGDSNTGIFFPSADTIAFGEGGVESARFDSSGRLGIGTNNPQRALHLYGNNTELLIEDPLNSINSNKLNIFLSADKAQFRMLNQTGTGGTIFLQGDAIGNITLPTANTSILNSSGRKILNQTGGVLQVVNTIKTNQFTTTSGSPVDVTGLSASITPSSTSSKVLVIAWVVISTSGGGGDGFARLVRDSTAIGNGDDGYFGQSAGQDYFAGHSKPITYLDSPATTSSTTYKIQVWGANTSYVNGRGLDASFRTSSGITLMEISG